MEIHAQNGRADGHDNGGANGRAGDHLPDAAGRTRQRKAIIVGAGLVGCLTAIALANKGWSVEVYEARAGVAWFCFICHGLLPLPLRQASERV